MVTSVELVCSPLLLQVTPHTPPPPGWPIPPPLDGSACERSGQSLTPLSLPPLAPLIRLSRNILDCQVYSNSHWWDLALCNSYWWISSGDLFGFLASRRMGQPLASPVAQDGNIIQISRLALGRAEYINSWLSASGASRTKSND